MLSENKVDHWGYNGIRAISNVPRGPGLVWAWTYTYTRQHLMTFEIIKNVAHLLAGVVHNLIISSSVDLPKSWFIRVFSQKVVSPIHIYFASLVVEDTGCVEGTRLCNRVKLGTA